MSRECNAEVRGRRTAAISVTYVISAEGDFLRWPGELRPASGAFGWRANRTFGCARAGMRLTCAAASRGRRAWREGSVGYIPWTRSRGPPHLRAALGAMRKAGMKAPNHTSLNQIPAVFGRVLREERKRLKLSQEQLALHAEVDRTFVSQIERGVRQPTLTTLVKLSRVLQVAPSTLVARMERLLRR